MQFNEAGMALVKRFESCRLSSYTDPWGTLTIGWGCTGNVQVNQTITQDEADRRLSEDLGVVCAQVKKCITGPLNDNQFSALVDFTYNEGIGRFAGSTLLRCLNIGRIARAAEEFERWDKAGGTEVKGLLTRRIAERDLFLTSVEE